MEGDFNSALAWWHWWVDALGESEADSPSLRTSSDSTAEGAGGSGSYLRSDTKIDVRIQTVYSRHQQVAGSLFVFFPLTAYLSGLGTSLGTLLEDAGIP
jgi:hypothetical protein